MDDVALYFTASHWLLLAPLCALLELCLPGIFMIWLGLAALPTALLTYLFGFDPAWQIGIFSIFTLCSLMLGNVVMARMSARENPEQHGLNQRGKRLIGETLVVCEPIADGRGRVREGDSSWLALGPDAPAGTKVRVVAVMGSGLKVIPLQG